MSFSISRKEDLTAFLIFMGFWISLLGVTNTQLSSNDISNVTLTYLKNDLKIRFRPFYFIHRIFVTKIFGDNIKYWSLYTGLLAVLSSFFFYKFLKLLDFTFFESILFSFLTSLGPQACIWWRLGPAETIGTFMLSVSLFFLSKSILFPKNIIYKFLSLISILFSSLSKESFVLFIPALILIYVFYYGQINKVSYRTTITKNFLFISTLFILFVLPLIFIFRTLSTNTISYAGVSNNYFSINFIKWTAVQFYKNFIIIISGIFLILQNASVGNLKDLTKHVLKTLTDQLLIFIIFIAIFFPQCILYFKSGMETRYYIPFALGFSLLAIYLLNIINRSLTISFTSKVSYLTLIVIAILYMNFKTVVPAAIKFTDEGWQTKTFIKNILDHSEKQDKVLFVLNPGSEYEWGFFLKAYFETKLNSFNFQFLTLYSDYSYAPNYISKDLFMDKFNKYIIKPEALVREKYSCIAVLPLSKELFLKEFPAYSQLSAYTSLINSNFTVYYLRKSNE